MKICQIEATGENAKTLYQSAEKVFLIPPYRTVRKAVVRGNFVPMRAFLLKIERMLLEDPLFHGPTVFQDIISDNYLWIRTDGWRKIYVAARDTGIGYTKIDFTRNGEGSVIAAGEIIGKFVANGGDIKRLKVTTDEKAYWWGSDYPGPIHPELSKITYRSDFAKTHPALLKAVLEAAGDCFCIPMYQSEERQMKKKLEDSTYNVPVLISYISGDEKGLLKGTALEIGEKLGKLVEKESRPSFVENIIDAIADDIGKPETNTLEFENVQVVVLDILEGDDSCAANT